MILIVVLLVRMLMITATFNKIRNKVAPSVRAQGAPP